MFRIISILIFLSCNDSKQRNVKNKNEMILGIWTDGWPENGTLDFKNDSVHYLPNLGNHSYLVKDDTLYVDYPKTTWASRITFHQDSLIMDSNGDVLKMWRVRLKQK
jgi:hypothetical protein